MNNLLINNPAKGPGANIYFCKVIRFMPSSNTIDCVTIDNNISLENCNIACSMPAGFAYGSRYFPSHDDQNPESNYINSPGDLYCVSAFLENDYNNAAVLGFLFPLETTLSIAEYGLYIFRHESDVIWMVRADGTMQIYHPSGSIIKIGDDNTNEVDSDREQAGLYPAKTDGLYLRSTTEYNAQKETNLFVKWYKGQELTLDKDGNVIAKTKNSEGTIQTTLTMTPDGDVTVTATNNVTINAENDVTVNATRDVVVSAGNDVNVTASRDVNVTAGHDVNIDAPAGNVQVDSQGAIINTTGVAVLSSPVINVTAGSNLNIIAPLTSPLTINGKPTKSGVGHEHSGNPQFYVEQGLVLE